VARRPPKRNSAALSRIERWLDNYCEVYGETHPDRRLIEIKLIFEDAEALIDAAARINYAADPRGLASLGFKFRVRIDYEYTFVGNGDDSGPAYVGDALEGEEPVPWLKTQRPPDHSGGRCSKRAMRNWR
jgi:hypothetical protein